MLQKSARATPHMKADRVSFDREAAYRILDEALTCSVAFVEGGAPVVIPTIHWRLGDRLYFHGSRASRLGQTMAGGQALCVSVTLVDGLVLARSAFHHSMNYRSVVLFGLAAEVTEPKQKRAAFDVLLEKIAPGRKDAVRPVNDKELAATRLLALPIVEGSVKTRQGPPVDAEADLAWPVWAGVVPLSLIRGEPVAG